MSSRLVIVVTPGSVVLCIPYPAELISDNHCYWACVHDHGLLYFESSVRGLQANVEHAYNITTTPGTQPGSVFDCKQILVRSSQA